MQGWDDFYQEGPLHTEPASDLVSIIPKLKKEGVVEVLDLGCGTGRNSDYLAGRGFSVHAIDVSEKAVDIARSGNNAQRIDYRVGSMASLPYPDLSMDFVLANHSIEYGNDEDIARTAGEISRILKNGRPILLRVLSKQHEFYRAKPEDIHGFSHVGFCVKNGLPVHFFDDGELRTLFDGYRIERLEHLHKGVNHRKLTIPLTEWIMLAYKD